MKNLLFAFVLGLFLASCSSVKLVGDVNLISTRNVDSGKNYQLLKTGADDSREAWRHTKAENIDKAINAAVLSVPGGEYLQNCKIYTDGKKWAVLGDVYGLAENANVNGYRVGDPVYIKNSILNKEKFTRATVKGFKDQKACLVEFEGGEIKAVNYSDLSKTAN